MKYNLKRILCLVLCLSMVLSLCAVGAMAEEAGTADALQTAVSAGGDVTLTADVAADITVPTGTTVNLNLNGYKLTNASGDTITVSAGANLTITGSGTVDNTANGKGALVNLGGTVTINGGATLTRSAEGTGNSWYTIKNLGIMSIDNATITTGPNSAGSSSLIDNGWYNAAGTSSNDRSYPHETNAVATLTIKRGTFSGGMNTVKNDDASVLTIEDGTFSNTTGPVVLNWNEATIKGGTFNVTTNTKSVLAIGYSNADVDKGVMTISGGTFNAASADTALFGYGVGGVNGGTLSITGGSFTGVFSTGLPYTTTISGGTFSADPTAYLADGYAAVNTNGTYTIAGAVATIGTAKYATLADAVAAAETDDTVTLLKDVVEGAGIIVDGTAGRTFTIDFGGHTYTVTHDPAGSTNTQSQCFQLLKGSTVTMKNGTITANSTALKMILQNYCNLTLEDMTIDATQGTNSVGYCMSNNCGKVNIIGSTSITAKAGQVAFDACWAPKNGYPDGTQVVLNTTGVINGNIEFDLWGINVETSCLTTLDIQNVNVTGSIIVTGLSEDVAKANIHISGGKFFSDPTAYLATGYYANSNAGSDAATYPFVVSANVAVATIGTAKYATMAEAITAAKAGDTIQLVADAGVSSLITLNKNLTIDLNGHKLSRADGNDVIQVVDNATLTINGTTSGSQFYGRLDVGISPNNNGNIVLNGGTYSCAAAQTVLHINGTCKDSDVTIKNATITSPSDNGIQLNGAGTFLIEDSTITGATAVYVKSGTTTIRNSTLTGNMSPANYTYNGNGANATGDALVVDACNYPGGNPVVNIVSGSFSGTKSAVGYYQYNNATATIAISGGNFKTAPDTALIKTGYLVKSSGSTEYPYTVSAGSVDTVKAAVTNAIDAATTESTPAAVAEAVQAVQATDPAVLTDPGTITKLAALETAVKANSKIKTSATVATGTNTITGVTVTNSALSVDPGTKDATVTVTVSNADAPTDLSAAAAYLGIAVSTNPTIIPLDINMTVGETSVEPKAPLAIQLKVGLTEAQAKTVVIVHYKDDGSKEKIIPTVSVESNIVYLNFIATSLSEYVLVETASEINPNAYTITMVPNAQYVNGGDTITYSVYVSRSRGTDKIGNIDLTLTPDGSVLQFKESAAAAADVTFTENRITYSNMVSGFEPATTGNGTLLGTLTYTVATGKDEGSTLAPIAVTGGISSSGYQAEASVKIVTNDVSYRNLKVTFNYGDARTTDLYVKYNSGATLYTDNTYATVATLPAIAADGYTAGTYYPVDANWHSGSMTGTVYAAPSAYFADATYYANVAKEYTVSVVKPAEVTAIAFTNGVRNASDINYASSARDVTFTVTAGTIYTPTVTYQIGSADPVTLTAVNGTYTIPAASITGNVTITVTVNVAVSGCKTFTTTVNNVTSWTPFSAYTGSKTLVLLNLAELTEANQGYEFTGTTIYKLPNDAYAGYNYIMLLPGDIVPSHDNNDMLTYIKQNITLGTAANDTLTYDYNTNGLNGAKVADVQAAYDFSSLSTLKWTPSEKLLLIADVLTYTNVSTETAPATARDGKIDNADIAAFLYDYAGFPKN